jgi:starvation-inducible DNA-binding protein
MTTVTSNGPDTIHSKGVWLPQNHETRAFAKTRGPSVPREGGAWRAGSVEYLKQVLAATVSLRDLYTLHRRKKADPVLHERHLLFDRHFAGQHALVDEIAQNIQTVGGDILATAPEITTRPLIAREPIGCAEPSVHLSRLLEAHNIVLVVSLATIQELSKLGAEEPSISNVVRTNETHVCSLVNLLLLENQMSISHAV